MRGLTHEVQSKIVVLLALMSTNRVADVYMTKSVQNGMLSKLQESIIHGMAIEMNKMPAMKFSGKIADNLLERSQALQLDEDRSSTLFFACQSFITVKYYFKLIQEEYSKNPASEPVRKALKQLFDNS